METAETGSFRDNEFVVYDRLRGHKGQVLCVAAADSKVGEALVATGAEDSTVRLWSLQDVEETPPSPSRTPTCPSGLTSSPLSRWRVVLCVCRCFDGEAVASVVFGPGLAGRLYCAAGGKVFEFDVGAREKKGLLLTTPTAVFDDGPEEVNEVAVHPKGEYLAAADDSGVVKIYSTTTRRLQKTLRNAHSSICNTVRFRPRASWDIATGALDSTLVFWDFSTGRVRERFNLAEDIAASSASKSNSSGAQIFNPPFVHSVDFVREGRHLAAGLGDGGVVVFDAKTRTPVGRCDGHSAPVSQVHYPVFDSSLLVSAGNDRRLLFWDHRPFEKRTSKIRAGNKGSENAVQNRSESGELDSHLPSTRSTGHKIGDGEGAFQGSKKSQKKAGKKKNDRGGNSANLTPSSRGLSTGAGGGASIQYSRGDRGSRSTCESQQESGDRSDNDGLRAGEGSLEGREVNGDWSGFWGIEESRPLSELIMEDKPNWITSITVPYDAVLIADTSSEVKILRRRCP